MRPSLAGGLPLSTGSAYPPARGEIVAHSESPSARLRRDYGDTTARLRRGLRPRVWHRLRRRRSDVAGGRADEAVVRRLLHDVGAPADGPAGGEGGGEHVPGDAAGVHDHAGVELHVGVELAPGLQLGQDVDRGALHRPGRSRPAARRAARPPTRSNSERGSSVL